METYDFTRHVSQVALDGVIVLHLTQELALYQLQTVTQSNRGLNTLIENLGI